MGVFPSRCYVRENQLVFVQQNKSMSENYSCSLGVHVVSRYFFH